MDQFYIPLPEYLGSFEKEISNFGLRFQKFFPYDKKENLETKQSVDVLSGKYNERQDVSALIKKKHERQDELLKNRWALSSDILKIRATLSSRLVTGVGETTPAEVGMVFDRNLGIPYIPAASIKGALAYAYCVNYVSSHKESDPFIRTEIKGQTTFDTNEPGFTALFGSREVASQSRGGFCFLDAYPLSQPRLVTDIMNPHFGKYYQGEKPPSETDNPIPIKFLAVEKGVEFEFKGFFLSSKVQDYRQELVKAFHTLLEEIGLGAKTAIGYGLFEKMSDESVTFKNNIKKQQEAIEEEKAEKNRKEKERLILEKEKARAQLMASKKEAQEKEYEQKLEQAEGVEKDILLLERGDLPLAYQMYEKYLKNKDKLSGPGEIRLAELVSEFFKDIPKVKGKKAKRNSRTAEKYAKRLHLDQMLSNINF